MKTKQQLNSHWTLYCYKKNGVECRLVVRNHPIESSTRFENQQRIKAIEPGKTLGIEGREIIFRTALRLAYYYTILFENFPFRQVLKQ